MSAIISAADVVDATEAVDNAEQQQAAADKIADGFVALAAFIRANPHLADQFASLNLYPQKIYVGKREQVAAFARAAAHAGLPAHKRPGANEDLYFGVSISFGALDLFVYTSRAEICERVVVGTETVTREVPDPELLAAVPTVTVTETVEQVEWRCGSLLAPAEAGA